MREVSAKVSGGAVCLCCDSNFLPIALFLADQIDRAVPDRDYDICICSAEPLRLPDGFADRRFRVVQIDPDPEYLSFAVGSVSHATYLRLWITDALADDYSRILYLDSDMFLEAGDPGELLGIDLGGRPIGAVRDMQQWRKPDKLVSEFAALGLGPLPYFNAGLMLIDTALYQSEKITERALALAQSNPGITHHLDQSLLNGVLRGGFAQISPVWNWQWVGSRPFLGNLVPLRIVHFVGHDKPWNDRKGTMPLRYRVQYERFLSRHFPDCPLWKPAMAPTTRKLAQMVYQSVRSYPALRRLIAQFPDPLRTIQ